MGFLRLIADFMRTMYEIPLRGVYGLRSWRQKRLSIELAARDLGKEAQDAKGVKGWLRSLGKVVLFLLLLIVVCFVLWILYYLNDFFDLPRVLGGPLPWLRPFWLPILTVLVLGSFYLAIRLWRLLGPERDANAYPDLEFAWLEVEASLVQAGINIREVPVFLVLGKPNGSVDALFSASRISWLVRQAPLRVGAPFQVYAHRQAVFLAVGGESMLGKTIDELAKSAIVERPLPAAAESVFDDVPSDNETKPAAEAAAPADNSLTTPNLLADEPAAPTTAAFALAPAKDRLPTLEEVTARHAQPRGKPLPPETIATAQSRFNSLMKILARGRRPFCSVNGVLLLVPNDALTNTTDAGLVAGAIEDDLRIVTKAGQTRCPSWLTLTDLHSVPGFDALFAALDAERRVRLLGRDFPFQPMLPPSEIDQMVRDGVGSLLDALGKLSQRLFVLESSMLPAPQAIIANGRLFELTEQIEQRRAGLEVLLRRVLDHEAEAGTYFGGLYLAATGTDPNLDQAFVPGLFRLMLDHQNKVAWTEEALAEESDYQRWAIFGYVAMAAFCALLAVLGYWRWQGVG